LGKIFGALFFWGFTLGKKIYWYAGPLQLVFALANDIGLPSQAMSTHWSPKKGGNHRLQLATSPFTIQLAPKINKLSLAITLKVGGFILPAQEIHACPEQLFCTQHNSSLLFSSQFSHRVPERGLACFDQVREKK